MDRNIEEVFCSCGGKVTEVDTTDEEEKQYGCNRRRQCCVRAWKCDKCSTRWTFSLEAPEPRDD